MDNFNENTSGVVSAHYTIFVKCVGLTLQSLQSIRGLTLQSIRGHKVMLSAHLAELYEVETRILNQAVKRNMKRFPEDFMFQLNKTETEKLVSQNVIPHKKYFGGSHPYAFTEQGIAMLSGVLNSDRAVRVNIEIMRAFIRLRKMLATNAALARKIKALEKKYDEQFAVVFKAIYKLMSPPGKKQKKIGFKREKE